MTRVKRIKNLEDKINEYIDAGKEFQFIKSVRKYFFEGIGPMTLEEYDFILDSYNHRVNVTKMSKRDAKFITLRNYYMVVEDLYKSIMKNQQKE